MQIKLTNIFRINRILKKNHELHDYHELTRSSTVSCRWICYIYVDDGCSIRNVLVITSKYWRRFWSPISIILLLQRRELKYKRCHQDRKSITSSKKLLPTSCHQNQFFEEFSKTYPIEVFEDFNKRHCLRLFSIDLNLFGGDQKMIYLKQVN